MFHKNALNYFFFLTVSFYSINLFGAFPQKLPFKTGELLTYNLRWSFVPAGNVAFKILPLEQKDGIIRYHLVMEAKTNSFVDVFYKVRDRIDSFTDVNFRKTLFFKKKQREGKTNRDIEVTFDWEKFKVQYQNKGVKREPIALLEGTFDPLAAIYFIRLKSLKGIKEITFPITDGKKMVVGKLIVVKKEVIEVPAGEFETYLVEPDIKDVGGIFKKKKNAKIRVWVTADERQIPVKVESDVIVGSFVGELSSISFKKRLF